MVFPVLDIKAKFLLKTHDFSKFNLGSHRGHLILSLKRNQANYQVFLSTAFIFVTLILKAMSEESRKNLLGDHRILCCCVQFLDPIVVGEVEEHHINYYFRKENL